MKEILLVNFPKHIYTSSLYRNMSANSMNILSVPTPDLKFSVRV